MSTPSSDTRSENVATIGGLAAVAITIVTASSTNAVAQAIVNALVGGQPRLDAEGFGAIVNAFLITAPLAIAVAIAGIGLARIDFPTGNNGAAILVFIVIAISIGLVLGNIVYGLVYSVQLEINAQDLTATISRAQGPWFVKIVAAIMWFVVGYYEFFGPGHFVAAFIAGGFGAYAAHQYLPARARW